VPVDDKDTVRLQCPRIPQNSFYTGYIYEVHFVRVYLVRFIVAWADEQNLL
jgi:hypothetical protein